MGADHLTHFDSPTQRCTASWELKPHNERIANINSAIGSAREFFGHVEVIGIGDEGQIIVSLSEGLAASERGTLLLDLEEFLKARVDVGLNVWCKPIDDKSTIRKLRGVRIDAVRISRVSGQSI